jgi:hypothetical protein
MKVLRALIREIVTALSEDPRSDPLITAQGKDTRGPASSMAPNPKAMVGKYHKDDVENDDEEENE